ncbi:MAG: TlpA family protein disulfide reductase [Armatimonadota bacterium]
MISKLINFIPVIFIGCLFLSGCSKPSQTSSSIDKTPGDFNALLDDHHGKILILLLGRDDCPGTAKATAILDEYVSTKPGNVSVVRLDVPLPNENIALKSEWDHQFPRFLDKDRKIADELKFFYYPTLYLYDGNGENRYIGALEKSKLEIMVREISSEKPGANKKIYTLPMPDVGKHAPAFSGNTLTGETVSYESLKGKRGLMIIFARISCPFSANEMPQFKEIADRFRAKGVNTVIINQQEELNVIKQVYEKKCKDVTVIWDNNGRICNSFGVDAVPFYFLLDKDGTVVNRRSFTHGAAVNSINAMLGLESEKSRYKPTEGG